MKKEKKQLDTLSVDSLTDNKALSLLNQCIQKLKSIGSLLKKHFHLFPKTITEDRIYDLPFVIAEDFKGVTMKEIEHLEKMLEEYKESIKKAEEKENKAINEQI